MITDPKLQTLIWALGTIVFIIVGSIIVAQIARWIAGRSGLSGAEQRKVYWGFLFASPWLIGFVIFVVGPSFASLYYSFTDYRLGQDMSWVGLDNYRELIEGAGRNGRNFKRAMFNSLYYAIIGVPLQIFAALGMAMILNTTVRGVKLFRLIFYMPVILAGGPAILLAWRYMLGDNGGFVNVTLQRLSESFFLFNWLYRGFIFAVEGLNGFFIGLTNGNPTGPLNFFLPAIIGTFVLWQLWRGDWEPSKREFAQCVMEMIAFVIGGLVVAVGLMAEPIDVSWTYVWALVVLLGWYVNQKRGQELIARVWQYSGLGLLVLGLAFTLFSASPAEGVDDLRMSYLVALAVSIIPVALTFVKNLDFKVLVGFAAVFIGIILFRIAPHQFLDGKTEVLFKYLTFQSAIVSPNDADYLSKVFGASYLDSAWLFIILAGLMVAVMVLQNEKIRRNMILVFAVAFTLIAISSAVDSVRYFNAFDRIADETGQTQFHFARFREATAQLPANNHNPKWLSSDLWVKPSLILINMWSAGAGMLIFLAALKGVPRSLYEAAEVDGAGRMSKFFKITLPMISPAMFYNVVIGMIGALQTFEAVYILRSPDTENSVMSAAYYLYQRTFLQANIGEGSAISWLLAVIIVMLTVMQFRYNNWVHYEA
jgi:ABC-type sugar transport system permease subunit